MPAAHALRASVVCVKQRLSCWPLNDAAPPCSKRYNVPEQDDFPLCAEPCLMHGMPVERVRTHKEYLQ